MVAVAPAGRRLSAEERRRQLLDVATEIVVEHGAGAMTMERLAEAAGVSKALPYKHFDNADRVLAAVYRGQTSALGRRVWDALEAAPEGTDLVRLGIVTYFDEIIARGAVLSALSQPGSTVAEAADHDHVAVKFEVEVLTRHHRVDRDRAKAIAGIVQGAVVGAAGTFHAGLASRQQLEDDLVALIRGLIGS